MIDRDDLAALAAEAERAWARDRKRAWRARQQPPAPARRPEPAGWQQHAACRGKQPLFFAPAGERPAARDAREARARAICAACPVTEPCRTAGRTGREYGIWGGESEDDRARIGCAPDIRFTARLQQLAAAHTNNTRDSAGINQED